MEFIELPKHRFFIATQAHPEFKSRMDNPSPLVCPGLSRPRWPTSRRAQAMRRGRRRPPSSVGTPIVSVGRAFPRGARLFRAGCCGAMLWALWRGRSARRAAADPRGRWGSVGRAHRAGTARPPASRYAAAYLREFSKSEQVVATGGVAVTFRGDEAVSTLRAERLVLEHKRDRFGLAGGVVLCAGDSLEVQADTLLWENAQEQLHIPGALRVEVGEGTGVGTQSHE